jgi:anthranilate synthase component 1
VFDHLTRGIALLHAGSDVERVALRREVIARCAAPHAGAAGRRGAA